MRNPPLPRAEDIPSDPAAVSGRKVGEGSVLTLETTSTAAVVLPGLVRNRYPRPCGVTPGVPGVPARGGCVRAATAQPQVVTLLGRGGAIPAPLPSSRGVLDTGRACWTQPLLPISLNYEPPVGKLSGLPVKAIY